VPTKEKRVTFAINRNASDALHEAQGVLELQIGFKPSLSQVVEFLAKQYVDNKDKLTGGQNV
jgi:hypothetical protein